MLFRSRLVWATILMGINSGKLQRAEDVLAKVLQEVLWSVEQVAQQLSISFHLSRMISVHRSWL